MMKRTLLQTLAALTVLLAATLILTAYGTGPSRSAARQNDITPTAGPQQAGPTQTPTSTPTTAETPTPAPSPTNPAPTLVPPPTVTPAPEVEASPVVTTPALLHLQDAAILRAGVLYNAYPFTWLNEQGFVDGYEAELLRAIAIELGVTVEFVQVTRHNAAQMLLTDQVDLLAGKFIAAHDREDTMAFSHPVYLNQERMVIRQDSGYTELPQFAGKPVGVEIGSRSAFALEEWMAATGISLDVRTYFTESEALDALAAGEVEGMVGTLDSLRRAGRQQMSLIAEPIAYEPYSIAVRRSETNLLDLLDRSLQRLKASGRVEQIYEQWFGQEPMDFHRMIPVYAELYTDTRTLNDFTPAPAHDEQPIMDRITNGQTLRVAGVALDDSAPTAVRVMNNFNRSLVEEMARRWGVTAEFLPDSAATPLAFVASGAAEIAAGITPEWDAGVTVNYSVPYLEHGNKVLVPARSQINSFYDLLGTGWYIGYFTDAPQDEETIQKYAEAYGVEDNIRLFEIQREEDAIYAMTVQDNLDMIYGDNLRLRGLMQAGDASQVRMLDDWYGDILPITFATPESDPAFAALVNQTLQDMVRDGSYARLWNEQFGIGQPLNIIIWPQNAPRP